MYKFPAYVEWPDRAQVSSSAPVEIGVLGDDAVLAALKEIAGGRRDSEREIRIHRVDGLAAVKGLHVLFIGDGAETSNKYIAAAHADSVLTVTEQPGGEHGSVINFVLMSGRVRFTVSLLAARAAHLKISSRLLAVAQDVRKGDAE